MQSCLHLGLSHGEACFLWPYWVSGTLCTVKDGGWRRMDGPHHRGGCGESLMNAFTCLMGVWHAPRATREGNRCPVQPDRGSQRPSFPCTEVPTPSLNLAQREAKNKHFPHGRCLLWRPGIYLGQAGVSSGLHQRGEPFCLVVPKIILKDLCPFLNLLTLVFRMFCNNQSNYKGCNV